MQISTSAIPAAVGARTCLPRRALMPGLLAALVVGAPAGAPAEAAGDRGDAERRRPVEPTPSDAPSDAEARAARQAIAAEASALDSAPPSGRHLDCQASLTCIRQAQRAPLPAPSRGPDLSNWEILAEPTATSVLGTSGALGNTPPRRIAEPLLGMDLVPIPGACWRLPDDWSGAEPAETTLCIAPFYIGVHEVTFAAFDRFVAETRREPPDDEGFGRDSRPVIDVNVYDALAFARWLTKKTRAHYRLPTEIEWEHAARAGSRTLYPWGDELGSGRANCLGCGSPWDGRSTAPVGSFPPNAWGLHDVVGNVGEWTCSMRDPDPARSFARCDGIYETRRRVFRNGAWSDSPARMGLAARDWNAAMRRTDDVGFRLLRECPECVAPRPPRQAAQAQRAVAGRQSQRDDREAGR